MKLLSTYFLIFIVSIFSYAQNSTMRFETIAYDENFPQSKISKITQSKKGFIWLGTENGLVRYDGYNFLRFYTSNKNAGTISKNNINDIYEDQEENLWVGTSHGLNLYNKNTNSFRIIDLNASKGGRNYISSLAEDNNNNVWVGTNGGLKKLNKNNFLLENVFTSANPKLNQGKVLSLFFDEKLGMLVGTSSGLRCFDSSSNLIKELPQLIRENNLFLKAKVLKIHKDQSGDIWFATESSGVFLFSEKRKVFKNYKFNATKPNSISSNNVKDILSINANTVSFATDDGLNIYEKDKNKFTLYKHHPLDETTIDGDNVTALFKDREGSIWLGTKTGSINFFNNSNTSFTNIGEIIYEKFGLNNTIVNALIQDKDETLWVGTNGGGLNYLNFKTKEYDSYLIESFKGKNIITTLAHKDDETILCGTLFGLFEFNKKRKKFNRVALNNNTIKISSLIVDGDDIWIGTDGDGLIKVSKNGNTKTYIKDENSNSISDNYITDIENRNQGLWISTQYGLNFFDKKSEKFTVILKDNKNKPLSNNTLTTLFTDSRDRLWVGMEYGGLNYYNEKTKEFHLINEQKGFTDGAIKSISEDSEGNLWVSSNNLLFQIKNITTPFESKNLDVTSYTQKDGITVKNYSNNCSVNLNDNTLVFGGLKGITYFSPNKFVTPQFENELIITNLIVNNKEVTFSKDNPILNKNITEVSEITLDHNQKFIGFQFSALSFINTKKNKYAYKLENASQNNEWHNIGTQNRVNLATLKSGTYLFKLKSLNKQESLEDTIKSFKIIIRHPWWETNLAYFIYIVLLLSILGFIINFIKSKVIIKQALFSEQLESERQKELYNMKLDFFTNISHEIRTPLTLIQGPLEDILDTCEKDTKLEQKLTRVKKNTDRLLSLINELLDFRKIESKQAKILCKEQDIVQFCYDVYESFSGLSTRKNIDYKFVMSTKTIPVFFDTKQMEKVIYNLLSNAFKFTKKNGKIVILIEESKEDKNLLFIKIKDNGIGITKESKPNVFKNFFQVDERGHKNIGSGIGLALSKKIIELHEGTLSVEKEDQSWAKTIFKITLKKGREHLNDSQILKSLIAVDEVSTKISETISPLPEILKEEEVIEDSTKKTVLIIDDVKEIRRFIIDILEEEYTVIGLASAKEALKYMENKIPDIIICDVMMPEMDGFEFCRTIKNNESTNHIPIILLTAKASVMNRIDGLEIGADAYITKPFSIKVLKLNIVNLLSSKEIFRQKYSGRFIVDSDLEKLDVPEELFIKKLMQIIESNIDKPDFDVNELVQNIGMSRTVLYKKVKALTNHSVASLIKHIRLKKAADILKSTNFPISEVTYLVGFNDRKHFSKEFKKVYLVSPTEYKNSQKAS